MTGYFMSKKVFYIQSHDSNDDVSGEIVSPEDYKQYENKYPGMLKGIKNKLLFVVKPTSDMFIEGLLFIEEKHPLFNTDILLDNLDDSPKEKSLYKEVTNLLKPYL